ncbi:MAG: outer membrane beta-barrel protein [Bryobacterales bacterium]
MKRFLRVIAVGMVATMALNVPMLAQQAASAAENSDSALRAEVEELKQRLLRLEQLLAESLEKKQAEVATSTQSTTPSGQAAELAVTAPAVAAPAIAVPSVAAAETAAPEAVAAEGTAPEVAAAGMAVADGEALAAITSLPSAPVMAEPQDEQPVGVARTGGQNLTVTGLVDGYYSNNFNNPSDGTNALYYSNPNAKGFGLNQAKLELQGEAGPIGFRTDIWFGSGARLFRQGLEDGPLEDVIYLQQAFGTYEFNNGASFDFGLFGTIAGLELAESHLNWNYSRGLLWAWNEPFSHMGARFNMPLSDTFTGRLMLVNGFDNARDNNTGKTLGYQGSWAPSDRFITTLTFIHGPENNGTNDGHLKDVSWNMTAALHEKFSVAINYDGIWNNNPDSTSQRSWGIGTYARWQPVDKFALAQRFEYFDDSEARSTGVEQILKEYTLTFEYAPEPRFITRLEYRRDWSSTPFFLKGVDSFVGNQDTLTLGMMWILGPAE